MGILTIIVKSSAALLIVCSITLGFKRIRNVPGSRSQNTDDSESLQMQIPASRNLHLIQSPNVDKVLTTTVQVTIIICFVYVVLEYYNQSKKDFQLRTRIFNDYFFRRTGRKDVILK